MKGGQRIDDHSAWMGKGGGKESVLPKGVHVKTYSDDGHDGHLDKYEDTSAAIREQQELNMKKAKGHDRKDHFRN